MSENTQPHTQQQQKSPAVAYLLWFFLGGFGAHRFYFGKTGSAVGMLGLSVGSTILSVIVIGLLGFPVLFGWWVVDAFLISKWLQADAAAQGVQTNANSFGSPPTSATTPQTAGSVGTTTTDESVSDAA